MSVKLLEIDGLVIRFHTADGVARAVDGVSLALKTGETLGLVGESGCGKSVTALSILGLVPSPPGRMESGQIRFEGRNLLDLNETQLRRIRGRDIAMIFQEPLSALNPVLPIGRQVAEPLMVHRGLTRSAAYASAARWLDRVRIPGARQRLNDYPGQLSGGMRQRVMIAMAMVCHPRLLIADEPTTALDVTIQAQILSLMARFKAEFGMTLLLITHDLGVIAQMATRVAVMYAGHVVEEAGVERLFDSPFHPYTRGLLRSIPRLKTGAGRGAGFLNEIPGAVPTPTRAIEGCRFAARCDHAFGLCRDWPPVLEPLARGHRARCWLMRHPERRKRIE